MLCAIISQKRRWRIRTVSLAFLVALIASCNPGEAKLRSQIQRTAADMKSDSVDVESYAIDHQPRYMITKRIGNHEFRMRSTEPHPTIFVDAANIDALALIVEPGHLRMARSDAWGHPLLYPVSPDKNHYRLVSAGPDGSVDPQSTAWPSSLPAGSDDIILQDGKVIHSPHVQ